MSTANRLESRPVTPYRDIAGKYRFIAEIGYGGMSEVFLTVTQSLGGFQKLVVVKLLRRDLADDEGYRQMFLREARLAAQLNHANVVQTYDMGEDHGRYYLAMEYLEGQNYRRVRGASNAHKLISQPMYLQMLSDMLAGLHYAHELTEYDNTPMQIVHRDVTPSNVFITYDGQVKLVDFGIAKDSVPHTKVGMIKGTTRYIAPEQITGSATDRRADIYSVGVMLWEVLTSRSIWQGCSEPEVLQRAAAGDVPPLLGDVHPTLRTICKTAMAHQPQDRYATANALRVELETYLAQYATPTRGRGLGAAISELFADDRTRRRQVIEAQLKGSRPRTASLPMLDPRSSGDRKYETEVAFTGAHATHVPAAPSAQPQSGQARSSRTRYLVVAVVVIGAAAAMAWTFVLTRQRDAASTPARPAATASVVPAARPPGGESSGVRGVTDDAITVGMSAAFSGASRELGNRMKLGLDTAFAAVNEGGGIAGRTIKLQALDDGYDGKRAAANMQDLIATRNVFAILGNVGTPTAKEALPYALSSKVLFFGAFTGSAILRRDPPDRYVFNYRASYEEETAKMISYLIDVKKVSDHGIVVFAQNDSYGDAGFDGASKTLRKKGHNDDVLRVGYERNTLDVDDAVNKIADYNNATVRLGNTESYRQKHPVKAIIMVGTYKASAKFIQKIRDRKIDAMFLNVSFVGSDSLAEELKERGPGYGAGVIVTQVVPHFDSGATGVIRYREALKKYHPDQQPDFVSLEGFVVGQLFAEGLRRAGRNVDTERLVDVLEQLRDYDPALGGSLSFGPSMHQASHKVWGTVLDAQGVFKPLDME